MKNTYKTWAIAFLSLIIIAIILLGSITVVIDPYFHYHAPIEGLSYPLNQERYQNNGIAKHFEYDAIIVGTSMASNYKTSDIDSCFGVNSVKCTYLGASNREIRDTVDTAIKYNSNLKMVIRSVDHLALLNTADQMRYDKNSYPTYLYDNNIFNDTHYIFNKAILEDSLNVLRRTKSNIPSTSFDDYSNWANDSEFGIDALNSHYERPEKNPTENQFTDEDIAIVEENVRENFLNSIEANPDIDFYLFMTPFSIYYFDYLNQQGDLNRYLAAERYTLNMLLGYDNVHLFSYFYETDLTTNLNRYKDMSHFDQAANTEIIQWLSEGKDELTTENINEYYDFMDEFYGHYDYDSLFE